MAPLLPEELVGPAFDAAVETIRSARTDPPEARWSSGNRGAGAARALAALGAPPPGPAARCGDPGRPDPGARLSERQLAVATERTSVVAWDTRSLSDEPLGPRLVAQLAPHLPEPLLPAALDALAVASTKARRSARASARWASTSRPSRALLAVAAAVGDPFVTAAAAPYSSRPSATPVALRFALAATKQMDPASRSSALVALIPHLSGRNCRKATSGSTRPSSPPTSGRREMARAFGVSGMQHTIDSALPSLSDADVKRLVRAHVDARLGAALAPRLSARQALALLLALDDEEDTSAALLRARARGSTKDRLRPCANG